MKPRVNLRLDEKLHIQLFDMASEKRVSKTAILEDALTRYFDPDIQTPLEERLIRQIDLLNMRLNKIERETTMTTEMLGHYVYYWLTRCDPLPESERDAAHALGRRRFDYFFDQVAHKLVTTGSLTEQVFTSHSQRNDEDAYGEY